MQVSFAKLEGSIGPADAGECQRSCRRPFVTIFPILRLLKSVPRCSLRRRSGARHPRHARARQGALCVAPGGSTPPISCVALRGLSAPRSGRESRRADRTGKLDFWGFRLDDAVALWIEGDGADRCPVAGRPTPALRVALPCLLVDRVAGGEHGAILPGMTLRRSDVADGAVAVLVIVPVREAHRPLSGGVQIGEPLERELRAILHCSEQCLGESIVITHARTRVGWLDAEPM